MGATTAAENQDLLIFTGVRVTPLSSGLLFRICMWRDWRWYQMKWQNILLAIVRCELKARYSGLGGWQVSAKGALPVVLVAITLVMVWGGK